MIKYVTEKVGKEYKLQAQQIKKNKKRASITKNRQIYDIY